MSDDTITTIDAFTHTITSAAREFGVSQRKLKRRVEEAGIEPAGYYRGHVVFRIADLAMALYAKDVPAAPPEFDAYTPAERRAWFESEKLRLEIEAELAHLVPAEEAAREFDRMARVALKGLDEIEQAAVEHNELSEIARAGIRRTFRPIREQLEAHLLPDDDAGDD